MDAIVIDSKKVPIDTCVSNILRQVLQVQVQNKVTVLYSDFMVVDFKKSTFISRFNQAILCASDVALLDTSMCHKLSYNITKLLYDVYSEGLLLTGSIARDLQNHPDMLILHDKGYSIMLDYYNSAFSNHGVTNDKS